MKILAKCLAAAGLLAIAACTDTPAEKAADNIEDAAENQADILEEQADNATNEVVEEALENQAEAVREAADVREDEMEDNDASMANTTGM